jgi:hypothetical protein
VALSSPQEPDPGRMRKRLVLNPLPLNRAGSTLEYTVTMLDFVKDKESWDLKEVADKLAEAGKKKEEGNSLFKAGKYERACKKYEKVSRWSLSSGLALDKGDCIRTSE